MVKYKRPIIGVAVVLAVVLVVMYGFTAFNGGLTKDKIAAMSYTEMIEAATKGDDKAVITVGIIKDGKAQYTCYGKNGVVLPQKLYMYEIASISKTITAELLYKAISEGKVDLEDHIDQHLTLPEKKYYPTIRRLVTHTSGYDTDYLESTKITGDGNTYKGVSTEDLINKAKEIDLSDKDYDFNYSNYGVSMVGAVLEKVYDQPFEKLIKDFAVNELGMTNVKIGKENQDITSGKDGESLGGYWQWEEGDGYLPAAGVYANIEDMLSYANIQLSGQPKYIRESHVLLAEANGGDENGLYPFGQIDGVGAGWLLDSGRHIVWHNGYTSDYNSFIGFDFEKGVAVVVLSNQKGVPEIGATVIGIRILMDLQKDQLPATTD